MGQGERLVNQDELLNELQDIIRIVNFYRSTKDNIHRLLKLVNDNQDFFGNPPAGQDALELATDKLEELIKIYRESEIPTGTMATCKMCGQEIRYVGSYWEHTGELQPRHPAWPK